MRSDRERLLDILDAIERIEKYVRKGKKAFYSDELIQSWMTQNIQIIGEAAVRMSEEFKGKNSAVPWQQIIAMRNILVHAYFKIDLDEVWAVIERDVPRLRTSIVDIIKNLPSP